MYRFVTIICLPFVLFATKYAGDFQELGVGGRACGMGGTGIASGTDGSVLYFNPATTRFGQRCIFAMHAENFGGVVRNEFVSIVLPRGSMTVSFALQYVSVGDIILTELADSTMPPGAGNPPVPYDTVGTSDVVVYVNAAKGNDVLAYGANVKIFYRDLAVTTGYGGGIDAGVLLNLPILRCGFSIRDFILSPLVWSNGTKELILPRVSFGLAPVLSVESIDTEFMFACDITKRLDVQGYTVNLGFECGYKELIYGRLGLYQGDYTLGAGLHYKQFIIDYAFVTHSELGNTNKISAGLTF